MKRIDRHHIDPDNNGFSLLEVMVALLLLTMVSTMIYSMLNRAIFFAERGERKNRQIEQHVALVSLLQRQVMSGWFNPRTKKVVITGDSGFLRLATASPFLARPGQVVMAFYRVDTATNTLYYLERKDFYNADYNDYIPDYSEMTPLLSGAGAIELDFDEETLRVSLSHNGTAYEFRPWCAPAPMEVAGG